MNRLVSEQKLSPTGKDWLLCSLDPFHDNQLANIEGWPDTECGASVVRCIKQALTVSKPSGLAAGNFDIHIILWPFLKKLVFVKPIARSGNLIAHPNIPQAAANLVELGGLQVWATPPGADLDFSLGSSSILIDSMDLDKEYTQGSGRLIGMGYEVHNTTSDLYRQGSVVVYRQQADTRDPSTFRINSTLTSGSIFVESSVSLVMVRTPPINTENAMLLQGSRQWTAEEGVYQVAAFHSDENSAYPINASCPAVFMNGEDDNEGDLNTNPLLTPFAAAAGSGTFGPGFVMLPSRVHPVHQSGSIFSGLSEQTTLTVNFNCFYESFPSYKQKSILALAKPSAVYDPVAMEIYSRVVQELPVGVPVRENGLGDWFLDAASQAAKYIGPVLAAMPHPIAKGAGAALSYLGETGQNYVKRQVPPNAWEQSGGGSAVSAKEANNLVKAAKQQQKKKDMKKKAKIQNQKAKR